MSTTLNAEEMAKKRYPLACAVGSMLSQRAIHRLEEFDDRAECNREAYAAAIREVAEPIAVERDEYRKALEWITNNPGAHPANILNVVSDALAKYPKP